MSENFTPEQISTVVSEIRSVTIDRISYDDLVRLAQMLLRARNVTANQSRVRR